ncbi:MAG: flagellar hook assembly protein FlgD [Phenylobacterium sp.]|uniref:flagellar hook assembly protein FlgD n=1 Tax=Phenylobacterium sp. TaxID=1871053 RepID=UPI0025E5D9C7|nr:flagellar hook assembly protein FlgD [Phenylobacterium sp.]MCA6224389.1 flagellar hook assembly protein FlgD [Phenylobacterium sp.]MCA6227477.1 flagellar hook assembly protein FlgD [Phenylobacterium sp.]MCA6232650.1 flagellar hook assembly protein FlgD [Phenylobacterium sp.]MCA6234485.1 flagellar hook assembly protein FlgD [Phenylobacterium sp.]MCA6247960.1 flagellar hook assembly protein FlgD [Phenylobacterium sp.]
MTVNSTTAAPAAKQDISILGKEQLATSYDTFMKLLSAQIKNQDPLSPMDGNQFTQQLVQMTGVQQQLYSNDLLKQLVTNSGTGMSDAVSVIGREITAASDKAIVTAGQAKWNYNLGKDAASVKIEVLDSKGKIVAVAAPTNVGAGDQIFTWNGTDLNGVKRADGGEYTLKITPLDASGATVVSKVFQRGIVTAVEQVGGQPVLSLGGAKVPWSVVTSVRQSA